MTANNEAARAFKTILESEKTRQRGWEERERAILSMAATGMSHRRIARALRDEALSAGLTGKQIKALGISEGNVHAIIRTAKAKEKGQ